MASFTARHGWLVARMVANLGGVVAFLVSAPLAPAQESTAATRDLPRGPLVDAKKPRDCSSPDCAPSIKTPAFAPLPSAHVRMGRCRLQAESALLAVGVEPLEPAVGGVESPHGAPVRWLLIGWHTWPKRRVKRLARPKGRRRRSSWGLGAVLPLQPGRPRWLRSRLELGESLTYRPHFFSAFAFPGGELSGYLQLAAKRGARHKLLPPMCFSVLPQGSSCRVLHRACGADPQDPPWPQQKAPLEKVPPK